MNLNDLNKAEDIKKINASYYVLSFIALVVFTIFFDIAVSTILNNIFLWSFLILKYFFTIFGIIIHYKKTKSIKKDTDNNAKY